MTFLDLFAGIGGFRRGLERSGHACVGHVEIDKYANKSYMAMYGLEYCPYGTGGPDNNSCRMCRQEVREDCDGTGCEEKCKGEWYAKDIKQLTAGEVPKAEIWTFGFPCTDISISGRMAGLHGERSGLFFAVTGLIKGTAPENKPRYLIIENVKHLVSNEGGGDFTTVLFELWEAGYDCEWCVVNSKDHGVPQHRERVYLVGYLRGRGGGKIFPLSGANPASVKRLLDGKQGKRVYDTTGTFITLTANSGGFAGRTGLYAVPVNSNKSITGETGKPGFTLACRGWVGKPCAQTLMTSGSMGVLPCCRIRRLTPRECWRLQAFEDFLFDRVKAVGISDAQLYKQAGNAVTVNVVYEIGLRLAESEVADEV